jgi:uncharacterized protein
MKRVIFDAFAVLAWLYDEPGRDHVTSLLKRVAAGELWGGVCSVNVGEVYYRTFKTRGQEIADSYLPFLRKLPWQVVPASNDLVWAAARLKARYPISYADAFALACAQQHNASLVTNDPELLQADHGTPILWRTDDLSE